MSQLAGLLSPAVLPGVITGLLLAVACGALSVPAVVRRLAFAGQGVSHSALGGVGLAAALSGAGLISAGGRAELAVVGLACVGAGVAIGVLSGRGRTTEDSAIGVILVATMALGSLLLSAARAGWFGPAQRVGARSWEQIMFGSMLLSGPREAYAAGAAALVSLGALWWLRRPLCVWLCDEESARGAGVPVGALRVGLLGLLSGVIVVAVQAVGVVLASALLVLPGATALALAPALGLGVRGASVASCCLAVAGVVGGLAVAFVHSLPVGPSVVGVLVALHALGRAGSAARVGWAPGRRRAGVGQRGGGPGPSRTIGP